MTDFFRMLHLIVAYNIDPRRHTSEASFKRVKLMVYIVMGVPVDLPSLIFQNIMKEAVSFEVSGVPYGLLLTNFLDAIEVPSHVGEDRQKPPGPIFLETLRKSRSQLQWETFPFVTSEIGPAELYAASHKRKNGDWLSDVAKKNHDHFDLDYTRQEDVRMVVETMMTARRTHRNRMHAYFKKFPSKEAALLKPYPDTTEEQWKELCDLFTSEAFMKQSEQNKKNRSKLTVNQVVGSRLLYVLFDRLIYDD
ncbi:hypothetical protein CJ030_MR4G029063 [Morella rubra]|uniref:Uncharacterized protein n=1 Tax=Morella rubra TaxID=262757 RepID=A0A6A1VTE4_9ROSI|nr:hypothetical protein CJ030_MR4G029063 [Morella rubra]